MNTKEAWTLVGGLSKPSKMPGWSIGIPAKECKTGAKLRLIPNSVCEGCYALKGCYVFKVVQEAQYKRLEAIQHPDWVLAMATLINSKKPDVFRWHDSGDLQSLEHLQKIFEVCRRTPSTQHWLPTREAQILKQVQPEDVPKNLIIRFSSHMIDQGPVTAWPWTSTVVTKEKRTCPAPEQGNACGSCRACWSRDIKNIAYGKH
mgnify:CR=1 FL=1